MAPEALIFRLKKAFKARYGTSKNDASNSRNDHLRVDIPLVILRGTSNELVSGSRLIPVEAEPLTEPAVGAGSVVFLPKLYLGEHGCLDADRTR